jgi:hypothetical protein
MNIQQHLFEVIKSKIPDNFSCPDKIAEILQIGTSAAYRRINGKTAITLDELVILCKQFSISLDEILKYTPEKGAFFQLINPAVRENYIHYIKQLHDILLELKSNGELFFTARDIPIYHFLNFFELLSFKLYAEHISNTSDISSYDDFCSRLNKDKIVKISEQVTDIYKQIPSKEIWTYQSIDLTLRLIEYHQDTGAFANENTILLLLEQLAELVDTIKKYATAGNKGNMKTPFFMFLCSIDINHDSMLLRNGDKLIYNIPLFAGNDIVSNDMSVCDIAEKRINNLMSKSTLISEVSSKERFQFFQTLQNKIADLVTKVQMTK